MEVRVCARGTLTGDIRSELAGFTEASDGASVVLCGQVVDQPELIGLLERLRRAGLRITDVEAVPGPGPTRSHDPAPEVGAVARIQLTGRVADLLRLVVEDAQLAEDTSRTTLEVPLPDDGEAFFELIERLEQLALEIREVHVHGVPGHGAPGAG